MNTQFSTSKPDHTKLLTPEDVALILIDHQSQMSFGIGSTSTSRQEIVNNTTLLAKTAKLFNVPTILSTVSAKSFSGPLFRQVQEVFPDQEPIDRTNTNAWEDEAFVEAVRATGKKRLVMAGLWTEVCVLFPALEALREGFEVYFVTDASAGQTQETHNAAITRMVQAGAVPVTSYQFLFEMYRDWGRKDLYDDVIGLSLEHAGAFAVGIEYAFNMWGAQEGQATGPEPVAVGN